jgi:hypothetical protein
VPGLVGGRGGVTGRGAAGGRDGAPIPNVVALGGITVTGAPQRWHLITFPLGGTSASASRWELPHLSQVASTIYTGV